MHVIVEPLGIIVELSAIFGEIEYFIPIDAEFYEESYCLSGITPLCTRTQ